MASSRLLDYHRRQTSRRAWPDLRSFCQALETGGQLQRVAEPVAPALEISGLCRHALLREGPALLFERPQGFALPVLGNLFGHENRILAALELDNRAELRQLGRELAFLRSPKLPDSLQGAIETAPGFARLAHVTPARKAAAPWQEAVAEGDDVDLAALPVSTCWPEDAGPLITFGVVITRGPRQHRVNLAIYRQQLIGRNKLIMRWLPHRGGAQDFREFQAAIPGPPVSAGGGHRRRSGDPAGGGHADPRHAVRIPVRRPAARAPQPGRRVGAYGLPIPALRRNRARRPHHAVETALEGPFADHTGYYNATGEFPVFTVDRISRRSQAVYLTTYMGPRARTSLRSSPRL
jgi:4-hydroxy-3-polyprenylbenzoate decarboxylase